MILVLSWQKWIEELVKKELKEVFVGKRVYSRFYGNGVIKEIEDGKLYVHFDEGQDRICYMKYLQEEM